MMMTVSKKPYLENDGVALNLGIILEDGINDVDEFLALQKAGPVLFKVVNKIVEDEVGAWNRKMSCIFLGPKVQGAALERTVFRSDGGNREGQGGKDR